MVKNGYSANVVPNGSMFIVKFKMDIQTFKRYWLKKNPLDSNIIVLVAERKNHLAARTALLVLQIKRINQTRT